MGSVTGRIAEADQEQDRGADREPAHRAAVRTTAGAGAGIDLDRRGEGAASQRAPWPTAHCAQPHPCAARYLRWEQEQEQDKKKQKKGGTRYRW